ncbi:MAG: glycosyltransferase family 39 protein [Endomicrobiaceae bacterium]|nr:glycosyltransferase family 39 protein [Endomicrobiaceae bacterium]
MFKFLNLKIMVFKNKKIDNTAIIFLTIAIMYAIGNFIWWTINTPVIPMWISAVHFIDIFREGNLFHNAPLLTWVMRLMFLTFGNGSYDLQIIFVNYVFFLIPLYFVYKIGVELKDKETGNIAMILFALVPAVYGMSRQYGHQDYHIIAGITFNIYCLIKTDYFRDRKWTIWYGISVGLGLMIKDAFLAYFFVPFIYIVIKGLKEKTDRAKVINVCMSIVLGSLIAGWHYFRPEIFMKVIQEPIIEQQPVFSFESLRVMTIGLWEELLSPPIFILFVIGLVFFIFKYRGKYKNVVLLWFFVPWSVITFMPHYKVSEYGAGFIPAVILFASLFLTNIKSKYTKAVIITFLTGLLFFQYIDFSYAPYHTLLDIKLKYKNSFIMYYNKFYSIMFYDIRKSDFTLKLIKYLKNNYPNNSIYIEEYFISDPACLVAQMYLNNINFKNSEGILSSDIILIMNKMKTTQDIVEFMIKKILENPLNSKIITRDFKDELSLKMKRIFKLVNQNYNIIKEFSLNELNNEDTKVTLLGRKDKFSEFNEKHAILDVK